jgi:phosphatidate cytidylyltransferase
MFLSRLVTAIVLLAACVSAMLLLPNAGWAGLLLPVLALAAWEWGVLAGMGRAARLSFTGVVLVSAAAGWWFAAAGTFRLETGIYIAGCSFWLLVALPWLGFQWRVRSALWMAVAGWLVLVPACLALARLQVDPGKLLALLGVIWLSDTAAYFAGRAWGRHKLAPSISPGKTWEGVAGALAAVAVYYVVLSNLAPGWGGWSGFGGAILFASVTLMGIAGDLFESWVKRQAAVKDSGTLLPGHGGVLDRIDSITAALPVAALMLPYIS